AAVVAAPVGAPIAATPVGMPVAESRQRPKSKPGGNRTALMGVTSAGLIALAAAGYWFFGRGTASETKPEKEVGKTKTAQKGNKKQKKPAEGKKIAELRGEFTVGPTRRYKTIGAALAEIKQLTNNKSKKAVQLVKVASGQTYSERIVIDET